MTPDTQQEPVLRLTDVQYRWADGPLLLNVDAFELAAGERVFLQGPSGSGKSTLLGLIAGIHLAESGHIRVLGQDLATLSAGARDRLRGAELGYVFQQFNLVPYLNVLENVLLPLTFSAGRRRRAEAGGQPAGQALGLLRDLGLSDALAKRAPRSLSVGQQQRVAVARALLGGPRLLICDEPTSALDAGARDAFLDVLVGACEDSQAALLFVSHDPSLAHRFSRNLQLSGGSLEPV